MNAQNLILDRSRPWTAPRADARPLAMSARPDRGSGRWALANFLLTVACIAAAVAILSVKLAGSEPCFQSPSGNCGEAVQTKPRPAALAPEPAAEAGLLL